jgi:phosphoglycolate phosphatase
MRYRLVIFDFDGTLADSFPWFSRVVNDIADRYRFKRIEPHEVDTLRTMGARELMRRLGVAPWKMPFIARHVRQRKSKELDQTRLFDGVDQMLARLSDADIGLALVTSNSRKCPRDPRPRSPTGSGSRCGVSMFGKSSRFGRVLRRATRRRATRSASATKSATSMRRAARHAFGAVAWDILQPTR